MVQVIEVPSDLTVDNVTSLLYLDWMEAKMCKDNSHLNYSAICLYSRQDKPFIICRASYEFCGYDDCSNMFLTV